MADALIGLFLVAHGLVHLAIYVIPPDPSKPAPFNPSRSWVLASRGVDAGVMRTSSIGIAVGTAVSYAAAGSLVLLGAAWAGAGVVAALMGVTLKSLWFHPWLSLGIAIDLAVLATVLTGQVS
jgi:hypothetical protein